MVRNISKNEEKKHSFFKLLAGFNTDCVRIPPKFLKHMSKDLSERATLKLKNSSDSSWTVKVKKIREGAVYFKNGWEEFIRDNSLGTDNEMLTIFYEGKMHFSIRIFGKNGIERTEELSSSESSELKEIKEEEEDSEDNTSEDLEADFTKIGSLHNNSTFAKNTTKRPRGRPRKYPVSSSKPRPSKSCKVESGEELSSSESIELNEVKEEEEDSEDSTSEDLEGVEPEAFKSNFPYFKGIINKTKCQFIPTAFSREHLPEGKGFKAILKNAEGEKWTVKGIPNFPQSHNFSAGWSNFVSANQIRIGDTCIFELLSRYQMTVHILRKR
ncbi:B3 domain-containing protein At2g16210-like [Prunus avium]|uniref:B3 domain-containing protein At2g16210-like n=1 Tax=Prunus avium TaxID=42229 RepID=A0A6P5TC50_PRUAV|nr:B3 domain-containing protein At2g16210-like [Prunus avium]